MRNLRFSALAAAFALALPQLAAAQPVGLGTTQGGATGQMATAIAQVVTEHGGLQVRPQQLANTSQYIPPINAGQLEFGIANAPQTSNAFTGTGMSPGQPNANLRLVATLIPFNAGLMASRSSGIVGYADLKGKRIPWFPANSLGDFIMRASLEAGGLKPEDVTRVPMPNFPRMFDAFKSGQTDVTIATVGSQNAIDFQQTMPGGVRFMEFKESDAPIVAKWLPGTRVRSMPVKPTNIGVEPTTRVFSYDYTLFTSAGMKEDAVYKMVKAIYENGAALKATGPLWDEFEAKEMSHDIGVPYHPGALKFFKEVGLKVTK